MLSTKRKQDLWLQYVRYPTFSFSKYLGFFLTRHRKIVQRVHWPWGPSLSLNVGGAWPRKAWHSCYLIYSVLMCILLESEWLDGYQYITEGYLLYLPTWGIFSLITFSKLLNSSVPQFLIYKMGIITVPTWKKVGIIQDLINPKAVVKTIVLSQQ